MYKFTEAEREARKFNRSLAYDSSGREVLIGLTVEETHFMLKYWRRRKTFPKSRPLPKNQQRYLELKAKHEKARLAAIGQELAQRR